MGGDERAAVITAARSRLCELGGDDHGHTDCWIIGGLLAIIDGGPAGSPICNDDRLIVGIWAKLGSIPNDPSTLAYASQLIARQLAALDVLHAAVNELIEG